MVPKDYNPPVSHPLYYIRKGLYNKISLYSRELTGRLMDFGCGSKPYQSLFTNVSAYVGLDYAGEGHSHEEESIDVYYDGKTIPFENESFDSVLSSEVFEHLFALQQLLPEIARVTKKGGKFLITCPFVWEEHEIPVDYARYTRFALKDMLEANGFEIEVIDKNGHFLSALHQLFVLYIHDFWLNRVWFFSRISVFRKIIRHVVVPLLNISFRLIEPILPRSDKLYLNTIVLARKK
ncbi:MAG: class I SAM-dependent methyltransferase [Bacteroidetes bacterium]|nr:class I SAM-dependent methyltransferase [Bacteroidota bacterium]